MVGARHRIAVGTARSLRRDVACRSQRLLGPRRGVPVAIVPARVIVLTRLDPPDVLSAYAILAVLTNLAALAVLAMLASHGAHNRRPDPASSSWNVRSTSRS